MNKKILATAIAATCATGAVHMEASAADKAKSQSLGDLSCIENQIAEFDGGLWVCIDTPSGGTGSAPEYEFVDGNGTPLGDVVFLEDGYTAWGYIQDLSETAVIQVTATTDKDGNLGMRLAGNAKPVRVWYEGDSCSGPGYLADYELPSSSPAPMFSFLRTEPLYYLPDQRNEPTAWTEVILLENRISSAFGSWNFTSNVNDCLEYTFDPPVAATEIMLGIPVSPVMPISVVEK